MSDYGHEEPQLIAGRLRGYRAWFIKEDGLKSTGWPHTWDSPQIEAHCLSLSATHPVENAPDPDCTCGIYATHTWDSIEFLEKIRPHNYYAQYWSTINQWQRMVYGGGLTFTGPDGIPRSIPVNFPRPSASNPTMQDCILRGPDSGIAAGVIEAWGTTSLGTKGFRAQHARIIALTVGPEPPRAVWTVEPSAIRIMVTNYYGGGYRLSTGQTSPMNIDTTRCLAEVQVRDVNTDTVKTVQVLIDPEHYDMANIMAEAVRIAEDADNTRIADYRQTIANMRHRYDGVAIYPNLTEMVNVYPPVPVDHILGQQTNT